MKKKTKIIIGIIIAVAVFFYLATIGVLLFTVDGGFKGLKKDKVAVISLSGSIADSGGEGLMTSAGITPDFVRAQLNRAKSDSSVKAIVLRVDSPGGSVGASQEIAQEIKETEKPIVVFMGDMAASGGYYISAPADKIVAKKGTLTGSIGVISQFMDLSGLYEKLGIKTETIKSGEHKDMFSRELTEEERELWQSVSDELYGQFIKEVAEGRNLDVEEVKKLATGELFSGTQAKKLGLVDELGGYQDAIDLAAELAGIEEPVVEEYPARTFFESVFSFTGSEIRSLIKAKFFGSDYVMLESLKESFPVPRY
ncbi:signal peptide peptidase SppA [Candidatus Oleimmundimicrobium sp.]|uniref:signal peptide peptidase SppA n=1 Tax=Candidatus Oleimmundimicrobium sp. TaxID=3060597 RepID=UPI0027187AEF|nr:signal peptide peptidase SppA [Candidatus Oleimmundimicrobium sp.]MDO8886550.1 signal peptide peptidase SppA [Candidatus Oleimmundimicrobium sp.]